MEISVISIGDNVTSPDHAAVVCFSEESARFWLKFTENKNVSFFPIQA
jgi:hypothetical protein